MIVNLGGVSVEEPRSFVGSRGKETRRNHVDDKPEVRRTFAFTTLLSARSSEVEDVKSVSFHPIDEPLLESSTTTQTCPFRNVSKGKHRFVDTQARFSDDTLSVSDYSSIYISVDTRDDFDVKDEDEGEDEKLPRTSSRRRLQLRNRCNAFRETSRPPSLLRFQKSGQEQIIQIPLAVSTGYDMSACDGAANITAHPTLISDDCDDEGLLLLPGSRITHRSRQLKPKFFRRRGRNLFPGLASMQFQMKRKPGSEASIIYRKYRGKGLDAALATEPLNCRTLATRSIFPGVTGTKNRNGKKPQTHRKVSSLSYLDIQARYKNSVAKSDERHDVMPRTKEKIPAEEKTSGSSVVVDTLRAPLDAPLSTLYEDDDEDSEILSSVSSFFQLSAGKSHINPDHRRLHQPNSLYHGFTNPDETDDEGTLLGEKLLEISTSENESTASQGRTLMETLHRVGDAKKHASPPFCKEKLLEKSDSASKEESDEMDFRLDGQLQSEKVKEEDQKISLQNEAQGLLQAVSPTDVKEESAAKISQKQKMKDKKPVKKDLRHVQNRKHKSEKNVLVPAQDPQKGENDLRSSNKVQHNHGIDPERSDENVGAGPAKGTQYPQTSTADDSGDEGIFILLNSSDISELTDCEFPENANKLAKDQVSAPSRSCLDRASHEGKPDQVLDRPSLIRTSGLRSLLKQPTYAVDNNPLVTCHANLSRKSTKDKKNDNRKEREQKNNESSNFTHIQRTKHRKLSSRYVAEGITLDDGADDDRQTMIFSDDDDDDSEDPYAGLYCVSQLPV